MFLFSSEGAEKLIDFRRIILSIKATATSAWKLLLTVFLALFVLFFRRIYFHGAPWENGKHQPELSSKEKSGGSHERYEEFPELFKVSFV